MPSYFIPLQLPEDTTINDYIRAKTGLSIDVVSTRGRVYRAVNQSGAVFGWCLIISDDLVNETEKTSTEKTSEDDIIKFGQVPRNLEL